jgi:hypothetical protein
MSANTTAMETEPLVCEAKLMQEEEKFTIGLRAAASHGCTAGLRSLRTMDTKQVENSGCKELERL